MNLSKLEVDMTVSNYKEMCTLLEEDIKAGNSKKKQLKEWECHFRYEKSGNKFIIKQIYEIPLIFFKNSPVPYLPNLEILLFHLLAKERGILKISKLGLFKTLKMINANYQHTKNYPEKMATYLKVNKIEVEELCESTMKMIRNNVELLLNRLQEQKWIRWSYVTVVKYGEVHTSTSIQSTEEYDEYDEAQEVFSSVNSVSTKYEYADEDLAEYIRSVERDTLSIMRLIDMQDVVRKGMYRTWKKAVLDRLREEKSIVGYFDAYNIRTSQVHAQDRLKMLKAEALSDQQQIVNSGVKERLYNSIVKKRIKAFEEHRNFVKKSISINRLEKLKIRMSDDYLQNNELILEAIIDHEYKYITDTVKEYYKEFQQSQL